MMDTINLDKEMNLKVKGTIEENKVTMTLSYYDDLMTELARLKDTYKHLESMFDKQSADYALLAKEHEEAVIWLVAYQYKEKYPFETLQNGEIQMEYYEQTLDNLVKEHHINKQKALAKIEYLENKGE